MAALPPGPRRRPRRGSAERPVNSRTYRGTWLLVGIPLLIAAFSVSTPPSLRQEGYRPQVQHFEATLPSSGRTQLLNVSAVAPGRSPETIVVLAHRDDVG